MSSLRPLPPSSFVATSANSEGDTSNNEHVHRRVFIGPMPEKVISHTEAQVRKHNKRGVSRASETSEDDDDDMSRIIKDHAFSFFLNEGGNVEDWGEHQERSVREEMLRRWRDSEWGATWSRRKKETRQTKRWVGGSFEIGNLLGLNILGGPSESVRDRLSSSSSRMSASQMQFSTKEEVSPSTGAADTFITAPTDPTSATPLDIRRQSLNGLSSPESGHNALNSPYLGGRVSGSATSSTALLQPSFSTHENIRTSKARTEFLPRPKINVPSSFAKSDGNSNLPNKSKGKLVHYEDSPEEPEILGPVPPSEVLERTGSAVEDTSAGATAAAIAQTDTEWGDVVLRDRMLVRVSYTRSESVGPQFDEVQNRTTSHLHYEDWAEFMVAWRKDRVEIYEDYSIPGKEWMTGHKHLAFIVPLKSPRTRLSLYSFVDLTFCLTCPPTPTHRNTSKSRWPFHRAKEGTNIFVFKVKSRSRAVDWAWLLWRHLGGQVPQILEIRNPGMDTRVKIDIPNAAEGEKGYQMFSRENVIGLCTKSLRSVNDWKYIIERQMSQGKSIELAWRMGTNLDWIWLEDDVEGNPRGWAVLCGLALKQSSRPAYLEIRLAEHFPSYLLLKDGKHLPEPPAIEGYLYRIKPSTQTKHEVYLATHDGNIFSLSPANAHPPSPPGLPATGSDSENPSLTMRQTEVSRGALQVMSANGVSDIRCIMAVRRAFHIVPHDSYKETERAQDGDEMAGIWAQAERDDSDDEDEGGEEGLNKARSKPQLRMKRSFELLLNTGHVVRFEAHSRSVALEWIERLRALVFYWKQRHRIDARDEMDLAQGRRPRLTPHLHVFHDDSDHPPEPPVDTAAPMPALGSLYNWCVLEGCKSVVRGGKVFMRRGLHGQYKLVQLFLVAGHLVQFRIKPGSSLHSVMRKKVNLVDAYVCSGYFAALTLPKGQYTPNEGIPRRYQDGLEADDPEEDMLFMVWYRPQAVALGVGKGTLAGGKPATHDPTVPALSAKRKSMVFRTRSKLERDAWCWALNCEIEKIVRAQREREEKLRQTGVLAKI